MAGVRWDYEPDNGKAGWWPDFKVYGVDVMGKKLDVMAEVKPVAYSPILVDPAFNKALGQSWVLMLGFGPVGDYIGFLARDRGGLNTAGIRLTDDGLQLAPLDLREYGSWAERLWKKAGARIPNAGVAVAINKVIERQLGKRQFHFPGDLEGRR